MAISKEEQLKEAWLAYFKNIQKENDLISIKGYIEIDDLHRIIIVATKITFISNKKVQN